MKIAILGGGLAAAYANCAIMEYRRKYQAVHLNWEILTDKLSPPPRGALYLRWIPEEYRNQVSKISVNTYHNGTREEYVRKQWGDILINDNSSSFAEDKTEEGYDPQEAFKLMIGGCPTIFGRSLLDDSLEKIGIDYDFLLLTFPTEKAKAFYMNNKYMVRVPTVTYETEGNNYNFIMYNGEPGFIVRVSKLWGIMTIEYTPDHIVNMDNVGEGGMIGGFMDIHPSAPEISRSYIPVSNMFPIGRYATFKRHLLSHEVYASVYDFLETML